MEPIISPWLIYAVSALDSFNKVLATLIVLSFISFGICVARAIPDYHCDRCESGKIKQEEQKRKRTAIISFAVLLTILLINTLVPTKETLYQMLILNYITPDNLAYFKGEITTAIDYIVNQIKSLKN